MRKSILIVVAGILLIGGACTGFAIEGFKHVVPASELRQAQQYWESGRAGDSLPRFVTAFWMAFESGVRWSIASNDINQMRQLMNARRLQEALTRCARAVQILNGYDDEGALSYDCSAIEESIRRQIRQTPAP